MKKCILFMVGWVTGIFVLNKFVFQLFLQFIKNENVVSLNAVAVLCTCIMVVFTTVYGVYMGTLND